MRAFFLACLVAAIISVLLLGGSIMAGVTRIADEGAAATAIVSLIILGGALGFAGIGAAYRKRRMSIIGSIGMVVIVIAAALLNGIVLIEWLGTGWTHYGDVEVLVFSALLAYLAGLAVGHTGLFVSLDPAKPLLRALKWIVIACGWFTVAWFAGMFWWMEIGGGGTGWAAFELFMIGSSTLVLLTGVGTLSVPIVIVSRASRRGETAETLDESRHLSLTCPKCGERQTLAAGLARCGSCRTRMFIEFEEPRCACGYPLFNLTGETCPECGRPIPAHLVTREGEPAARLQDDPHLHA